MAYKTLILLTDDYIFFHKYFNLEQEESLPSDLL